VLGTAYKPDIDDLRESPALDVIALLREKKADVAYHDPHILHIDHEDWALDSVPDYLNSAKEADVVVIITNHKAYDYPELLKHSRLIFDSRNAFGQNAKGDPKVVGL
jgi:UDP-N-acetyl-D-glucosamine dehydrogenase